MKVAGRGQPTHYELLGLRPSAKAQEIRAAYVRQLKRYHPDSADARPHEKGPQVAQLTAAYAILKDKQRRAQYDAQLRRQALAILERGSHLGIKRRPRRPTRPRNLFAWGMALVIAVIVTGFWSTHPASLQFGMSSGPPDARTSPGVARDEIPSPAALEPIARSAGKLSVPDAVAFSSRCFARAGRAQELFGADSCIAFDTAFVYWRQDVGTYLSEPYFQPQAVNQRIAYAFPRLDEDAAMVRSASIRASTFEALLRIVNSSEALEPPPPVDDTIDPKDQPGQSTPPRDGSPSDLDVPQ